MSSSSADWREEAAGDIPIYIHEMNCYIRINPTRNRETHESVPFTGRGKDWNKMHARYAFNLPRLIDLLIYLYIRVILKQYKKIEGRIRSVNLNLSSHQGRDQKWATHHGWGPEVSHSPRVRTRSEPLTTGDSLLVLTRGEWLTSGPHPWWVAHF